MSAALSKSAILAGLLPEWPEDLLADIQARIGAAGRKVVVLDDDPTGTQTVHGVPVLTTWSVAALARELEDNATAFYILTNSRSLTAPAAASLGREIGAHLKQASLQTGVAVDVISRSDSTLRGHFPGEVNALKEGLGAVGYPCLLVPFFLEGERYTIGDVHYVGDGDKLVPAGETPYAQDAVFGYQHSNLRRWVEEKIGQPVPDARFTAITLDDLRLGGPYQVAQKLSAMAPDSYGIVNAASYRDLEVLVAGLLQAEADGKQFVFRTAASFVRVRAGLAPRKTVRREELTTSSDHGGLFLVGSYVPKTTAQLTALLKKTDVAAAEFSVARLLDKHQRKHEIDQAIQAVNQHLQAGKDTALFTSRDLVKADNDKENLSIGRQVSDSLIEIVRGLTCQPRYLVAKGGITSSDVATRGLGVCRAMVMGQVLPGVPVWKLGDETRYPGMAYIVFPGNVGDDDALVTIQKRLAFVE